MKMCWWRKQKIISHIEDRYNEIQGVPLLSKHHDIIPLDTEDDVNHKVRNHEEMKRKVQMVLDSDVASNAMDVKMRRQLEDYITGMERAHDKERLFDALNLTLTGVAQDVCHKMAVDLKEAELEELLKAGISSNSYSRAITTQPGFNTTVQNLVVPSHDPECDVEGEEYELESPPRTLVAVA